MRFHTDTLTTRFVEQALQAECNAGRIADHVGFKILQTHGSRRRARALEIQLSASRPGDGRRVGNSGSYGAMRAEIDGYAATYDEWGWLLSALFRADPHAVVGTPKSGPYYDGRAGFNEETGLSYDPWTWYAVVMEWSTFADERDPYPWYIGPHAVSSRKGYRIGRCGAGRADDITGRHWQRMGWPASYHPRTVADVLEFARLTEADIAAEIVQTVNA